MEDYQIYRAKLRYYDLAAKQHDEWEETIVAVSVVDAAETLISGFNEAFPERAVDISAVIEVICLDQNVYFSETAEKSIKGAA